jgi:hypothetical protein
VITDADIRVLPMSIQGMEACAASMHSLDHHVSDKAKGGEESRPLDAAVFLADLVGTVKEEVRAPCVAHVLREREQGLHYSPKLKI